MLSLIVASVLCAALGGAPEPLEPASATLSLVAFDETGASPRVTLLVNERAVVPPAIVAVAPGVHRLAWLRDGEPSSLGSVTVRAGEFIDVVLDVRAAAASVSVLRDAHDPAGVADVAAAAVAGAARGAAPVLLRVLAVSLVDDAPLPGARLHRRGGGELGATDEAGRLVVTVPAGAVALSVILPGYAPQVLELDLHDGAERDVKVALLPLADELDELTVRAPLVRGGLASAVAERRAQKQVVDVVGSEQMKKSGDGDAAQALRRVTGLTVVGGRFVYVRGLGDRYSATLVNGATLPSPEPERRVVPLDLFPAAVLDSLLVQKTWSPDLPGEFGGGSVQLRTRSDPRGAGDKPLLSFGVSAGALLGTTATLQAQAPAGALDALALDDGRRAVPRSVVDASRAAPIAEGNALTGGGLTKKDLERLGESFSQEWVPRPALALPALGASAAAGDTFATPWGSLSALAALTWSTDTSHTETSRQLIAGSADALVVTDDLRIDATERSVAWGGVLSLSLAPRAGQQLRAVTLLNRGADDEARVVDGHDDDSDARLRLLRLRYVARQLFVQQLAGTHALPWAPFTDTLQLDWRAGYALAQRDEPGQRMVRYDEDTDGRFLMSARSDGNQILTSGLVDHVVDARVALRVPFATWSGDAAAVSVGLAAAGKVRTVDTRRFKFLLTGPRATDADVRARSPDAIFTPELIGADGFTLAEATRNTDNHTGSAVVGAGFVQGDLPVLPDVVLSGGVRLEASQLRVTTFELFNAAAAPVVADLVGVDV
ncbi:MAG: hypothetical protein FJ137_14845, partial [Deltaproteobacteria bacterium]|nr:hypothetical protein [Deltaproteobacteria bacterium]